MGACGLVLVLLGLAPGCSGDKSASDTTTPPSPTGDTAEAGDTATTAWDTVCDGLFALAIAERGGVGCDEALASDVELTTTDASGVPLRCEARQTPQACQQGFYETPPASLGPSPDPTTAVARWLPMCPDGTDTCTPEERVRCVDGTRPLVYIEPAAVPSDDWVIVLGGEGGRCGGTVASDGECSSWYLDQAGGPANADTLTTLGQHVLPALGRQVHIDPGDDQLGTAARLREPTGQVVPGQRRGGLGIHALHRSPVQRTRPDPTRKRGPRQAALRPAHPARPLGQRQLLLRCLGVDREQHADPCVAEVAGSLRVFLRPLGRGGHAPLVGPVQRPQRAAAEPEAPLDAARLQVGDGAGRVGGDQPPAEVRAGLGVAVVAPLLQSHPGLVLARRLPAVQVLEGQLDGRGGWE